MSEYIGCCGLIWFVLMLVAVGFIDHRLAKILELLGEIHKADLRRTMDDRRRS